MQINSVTYTKALAIMLVVLGHAFYKTPIESWVNLVHVPAFFFMSGYCFKESHLDKPYFFFKRRIEGLYIPFIKWGLLFLLFHNVFYNFGIYNATYGYNGSASYVYSLTDFFDKAKNILLFDGNERLLGAYWFLSSLFFGYLFFYFTLKVLSRIRYGNIIAGGILLAATVILCYINKSFYMISFRNFMAAFVIWAGYIYRGYDCRFHLSNGFILFSMCVMTIISLLANISFVNVLFTSLLPFIFVSILSSIGLFGICSKIENCRSNLIIKILQYIGNNTLTILTWHFTSFVLVSILIVNLCNIDYLRLAEFPTIEEYSCSLWGLVYFSFGMIIPLCIAYFNRFINSKYLKL